MDTLNKDLEGCPLCGRTDGITHEHEIISGSCECDPGTHLPKCEYRPLDKGLEHCDTDNCYLLAGHREDHQNNPASIYEDKYLGIIKYIRVNPNVDIPDPIYSQVRYSQSLVIANGIRSRNSIK